MVQRLTTNDNEWYNKWQQVARVTTSSTSENEWKRVTTSGTTNDNEWHIEWKRMKANESGFRFQNQTIMQYITTTYSATSFWKHYVKHNICRSSYRISSIKKLLLKILQYSHETTWRPASVFLWILRNFYKNTCFEEHLQRFLLHF